MASLSETELKRIIKGGETNTVELKLNAPRAVDLAERFCGMANAQGGLVIFGVSDSSEMVGVSDDHLGETVDVVLRAARQVITPELVLDPVEPETYTIDGKNLVVATVKPSNGPIYQAGGKYWVRRGTNTGALAIGELSEMIYDRGLRNWELEPAFNAAIEDLNIEAVRAFLDQRLAAGSQARRFSDIEQVLIGMECAVRGKEGKVVPTNAGIMFFGHDPQWHVKQAEVVCVLFREAVGASRYADRKIITGTVKDLIDGAEAFLKRYVAVGARVEGFKRIDIPEYSIEVLREAVINAVVHRDYSRRGESVRMFFYPDRVEVHSPGLLLPGITVEQMRKGVVQSKLRNPVLAGLLRDVPGYMERIGSGIRFMLDETKRMELPVPDFKEMNEFVVTFAQAPALAVPRSQFQQQYSGTLWGDDEQLLPGVPAENLSVQEDRLVRAMVYVREHGSITNAVYRELLGVSDRTATRNLETLVERGRLRGLGKRRARRYVLA